MKKLKTMKQHTSEEGFTLIELMIVVVIIGILAAIAIPIFATQQKEAALAALKSDVKNIATMAATFKTKNDGRYPTTCAQWDEVVPQGWQSESSIMLRVKTSPDGMNLWMEAQPRTLNSDDPTELKEVSTIVYGSHKTGGLMTRADWRAKYNHAPGASLSDAEGFTVAGFRVGGTAGCGNW